MTRLAIIDALLLSDRTPGELRQIVGSSSNLLAFHLDVLEGAGLVSRHRSQGDRRCRYVTVRDAALAGLGITPSDSGLTLDAGPVLFVCSRNSARSQLAAALWTSRTGRDALSAGVDPAPRVHRHAVEVARRHRLDLDGAQPSGYEQIAATPELVVSVCDRAREAGPPFDAPLLHWSVPNPSGGDVDEFERAYATLRHRVDRLAEAVAA